MSAANKAKGSRWEIDLENYLNENGIHARRLPRAGVKDIGDVAIELANRHVIVIEAKNTATQNIPQYLREASIEADHYEQKYKTPTHGVVVTKTRGKSTGEGRVILTLDALIELLTVEGIS